MKFHFPSRRFIEKESNRDKPALISPNQITSWGELELRVESLVNDLSRRLTPGYPVVIYGHKEHEYIAIILACIQLQVPYVPVDTLYPEQRLFDIMKQLGKGLLINLEKQSYSNFDYGSEFPAKNVQALMYILFTSGSTGAPKGVQITYSAFLDFWAWVQQEFPTNENSVIMGQSLFTFDVSVLDIAASMGQGGSLILVDRSLYQDRNQFFQLIQDHKCTVWVSTPSFIPRWLLSKDFNKSEFPTLEAFIFIGEPLSHRIASELNSRFHDGCVYNAYGPTEATVVVTLMRINQQVLDEHPSLLPIGYPKPTGEVIVLDKSGNITSGEGEIVICGENVSIGYLDKTLAANNAFFKRNNVKAYRTGDFGMIKDDLLFCLGRIDDQVKLNGYRIEVGEIEAVLDQIPGVEDTVVLGIKRNNTVIRLVAFIFQSTDNKSDNLSVEEVKLTLQRRLPQYMIPSEIIMIPAANTPYSSSGKIDRKLLLELYEQDSLDSALISPKQPEK